MNLEGNWNGAAGGNKMQFNGNEWNSDLGLNWNDHNARWYDPAIGRWASIDPLADLLHNDSPYSFAFNSPMVFSDPDGMCGCHPPDDNTIKPIPDFNTGGNGDPITFATMATQAMNWVGLGGPGSSGDPYVLPAVTITYHESQQEKQDRALRWNKAFLAPIPSVKTANDLSEVFKGGILFTIGFIDAGVIYGGTYTMSQIAARNAAKNMVQAAEPLLLEPGIAKLTQEALEHIAERHWFSSGALKAGKFAKDITVKSLKKMIEVASKKGIFSSNTRGRLGTIAEYDFGEIIGTNLKGIPTSRLRIVINPNGTVKTAFPY